MSGEALAGLLLNAAAVIVGTLLVAKQVWRVRKTLHAYQRALDRLDNDLVGGGHAD